MNRAVFVYPTEASIQRHIKISAVSLALQSERFTSLLQNEIVKSFKE